MIFNSYYFILIFLPLVAVIYFSVNKYISAKSAHFFLLLSSLFFMCLWNIYFTLILLLSVLFNYSCGSAMSNSDEGFSSKRKKIIFLIAVTGNILLLGFFKYTNFLLGSINSLFLTNLHTLNLLIPIGISFYTFMQLAWITDVYRYGGFRYNFISYCFYVTFFPYVISGPIAYHKEIIPQFESDKTSGFNIENLCRGLFIFSIGLLKKTVIADSLAIIADGGFGAPVALGFTEAWLTSLSFTMQLYFDFSGYTDMAIGVALIFNIKIPANFNSPYKSLDIREFWRRWHITLSRFMRDYIYISLGGNRSGEIKTLINLMMTFLIGGLWHGAAWTFVFWGFLHGSALVIHRLWLKTGFHLNKFLAWFMTFNFVNAAWVFFRAKNFDDALNILKSMTGLNGIVMPSNLENNPLLQKLTFVGISFGEQTAHLPDKGAFVYYLCIIMLPFVLMTRNSNDLLLEFQPNRKNALAVSLMMIICLLLLNQTKSFVYFNF
jgi:D-alanyl-lipoteichoic acid acyltransferase DltB (MBOAT superfamily)